MSRRVVVGCVLLAALPGIEPRRTSGSASSKYGFAYLGHFCFDNDLPESEGPQMCSEGRGSDPQKIGLTQVTIVLSSAKTITRPLQVYLYDDEDDGWPVVWVNHAPIDLPEEGTQTNLAECHARYSAWHAPGEGPCGWLPRGVKRAGHLPYDGHINVTGGLPAKKDWTFTRTIYQKARPRTWFVALGDADCYGFEDISFKLTFQNSGGAWKREFGVNEQGLNLLYGIFLLAYLGLIGLQFYSRSMYRYYHHLPKLLMTVLTAEGFSCFLFTIHFLTYTFDGEGLPLIKFFAECAQAFSKLVLVLLLVLVAQGWTVVRAEVQYRRVTVGMMLGLTFATLVLLIWGEYPLSSQTAESSTALKWLGRDPASTKCARRPPSPFAAAAAAAAAAVYLLFGLSGTVRDGARVSCDLTLALH